MSKFGTLYDTQDNEKLEKVIMKIKIIQCDVPQQPNGCDCGMYVTKFAETLIKLVANQLLSSTESDLKENFKNVFNQQMYTKEELSNERRNYLMILDQIRLEWVDNFSRHYKSNIALDQNIPEAVATHHSQPPTQPSNQPSKRPSNQPLSQQSTPVSKKVISFVESLRPTATSLETCFLKFGEGCFEIDPHIPITIINSTTPNSALLPSSPENIPIPSVSFSSPNFTEPVFLTRCSDRIMDRKNDVVPALAHVSMDQSINGKNETVLVADPNADQKGDEDENSEEEIVGNFSSDGNHLYYHDGVINVDRNTFSSEAPRQYLAQPKHTSMITGVLEHFGLSN
jgi:hypothetical protein